MENYREFSLSRENLQGDRGSIYTDGIRIEADGVSGWIDLDVYEESEEGEE